MPKGGPGASRTPKSGFSRLLFFLGRPEENFGPPVGSQNRSKIVKIVPGGSRLHDLRCFSTFSRFLSFCGVLFVALWCVFLPSAPPTIRRCVRTVKLAWRKPSLLGPAQKILGGYSRSVWNTADLWQHNFVTKRQNGHTGGFCSTTCTASVSIQLISEAL